MGGFRVSGPGQYRQSNGGIANIRENEGTTDYPWEGVDNDGVHQFWNEDGSWWDEPHERGLIARIDKPQTEMAGLSGFDIYDSQGHYRSHYKVLADAMEDTSEGWKIVDRSLIPASAIVKSPEPKTETRKILVVMYKEGDVDAVTEGELERNGRNWLEDNEQVVAIVKREITFQHGKGLGDAS